VATTLTATMMPQTAATMPYHHPSHHSCVRPRLRSIVLPGTSSYPSHASSGLVPSPLLHSGARSMSRSTSSTKRTVRSTYRNEMCADRFIPSRRHMNMDLSRRVLFSKEMPLRQEDCSHSNNTSTRSIPTSQTTPACKRKLDFNKYLLSSLCNIPLDNLNENAQPKSIFRFGGCEERERSHQPEHARPSSPFQLDILRSHKMDYLNKIYSTVPQQDSYLPIPADSYQILDAPGVTNDFYLNLISWSEDNVLALALGSTVYLWNSYTRDVQVLSNLDEHDGQGSQVVSVKWCSMHGQTHYIAVGTKKAIYLFDSCTRQLVRTYHAEMRAAVLSWNDSKGWLTAGFQNGSIYNIDTRSRGSCVLSFERHELEVCGLAWNSDGSCLASGSNDDTVCLWDASMISSRIRLCQPSQHSPRLVLTGHTAAVKSLAWCPFNGNVLATGGGMKDRTIKLWNSTSGALRSSTSTGSVVSSLRWDSKQLYSSHGQCDPCVMVWKPSSMIVLQKLKGFTKDCILSMEMSPDCDSIVCLGADERLHFWKLNGENGSSSSNRGLLSGSASTSFGGYPVIR